MSRHMDGDRVVSARAGFAPVLKKLPWLQNTSTLAQVHGRSRVSCTIELSPCRFAVAWIGILSLNVLGTIHFFNVAYLHYYIVWVQVDELVGVLGPDILRFFPWVIILSSFLSAINGICALTAIFGSLRHKQLTFAWGASCARWPSSIGSSKPRRRVVPFDIASLYRSIFDIEGAYYEAVFGLSELAEKAAQTYQAWKLSRLVPTVWINRMLVTVIVLGCWGSPFLHRRFAACPALYRVAGLTLNAILNFVVITVFPLAIFMPYVTSFITAIHDFPHTNYYEDTWFINGVAENHQLFVMSPLDLITKILPAFAMLFALFTLRRSFVVAKVSLTHIVPAQSNLSRSPKATSSPNTHRRYRLHDIVLLLWGTAVCVIHIHASTIATQSFHPSCYLNLRPWFSTEYNCAVFEVNCDVLGHRGHQSDMEKALTGFKKASLRGLIIASCPELEMPTRIQQFSRLWMIKIYNSSISSWPLEAAYTGTTNPGFVQLFFVHTNFSNGEIPPGMLSDDVPTSLIDVEFCKTNINTLPPAIKTKWPWLLYLVIEASTNLTEVPQIMSELNVQILSLALNHISVIADETLAHQSFSMLLLGGNPVAQLPSTIGSLDNLYILNLGDTDITFLPVWMTDKSMKAANSTFVKVVDVMLGGSPVCSGDSTPVTAPHFEVDCSPGTEKSWLVQYPLEFEESRREWRSEMLRQAIHR